MSEQTNQSLDDLFSAGTLDLGSTTPDFDPFASADITNPLAGDVYAKDSAGTDDEEASDEAENISQFPDNEGYCEQEEDADDEQPENIMSVKPVSASPTKAAVSNIATPDFNPLAAAVSKVEEQNVKAGAAGILAKPPIFIYGGAKEEITDKALTFEQLRIAKSEDFPELDDVKKVTWTMEYGKISKPIPKPKETVIHALKEEIEASKEFLEMLKKQKDKPETLECKVKPRITAQSKGVVSPYKGVFTCMEEAAQSDKAIRIVPGRDGKVYEIRCTDIGNFAVSVTNVPELSEVSAGFFPALPPIPFDLFCQVVGFFRHFMGERELEAMVHIYWDKELLEYRIAVPHQFVGRASVEAHIDIEDALDDERYVCLADIHSHNSMAAKFSATDDRDERMTRVYIVLGRLHQLFPEISARISCGGRFLPISPALVIEGLSKEFPEEWVEQVENRDPLYSTWGEGLE